MKKILLAATMICALASCQKKQCYQCTVTVNYYPNSIGGTGVSTTQVCDMTEKDKENYEKNGTMTTTGYSGNVTVTQTTTTRCN